MKNLLAALIVYLLLPVLLACAVQSRKAVSWKNSDNDTALAYLMYMECPESSHFEAIKAQAILLRSSLCLFSSGEWSALLKKSTKIIIFVIINGETIHDVMRNAIHGSGVISVG